MPHRRPKKKGSFASHFDELVKHFEHRPDEGDGEAEAPEPDQRIFEKSWRETRSRD